MRQISLLLKLGAVIFLLDRWLFQPIVEAAKHKGPWVVFKTETPRKRRKGPKARKESTMKKTWFAGLTGVAILAVAGIAILAVALYNRFAPAAVKEVVSGSSTPAA